MTHTYLDPKKINKIKGKYDWRERVRECEREGIYVPGTTAFNHGDVGPEGGWVVVSWVPLRLTSVDLAASHPESSRVFPILAIAFRTESWLAQKWEREFSMCLFEYLYCRCVSLREKCTGRVFLVFWKFWVGPVPDWPTWTVCICFMAGISMWVSV